MWVNWISGAQKQAPDKELLAVQFGTGDGFFSLGEAKRFSVDESWASVSPGVPIVGGQSFFRRQWGAWGPEETFEPEYFLVANECGIERVVEKISLEPTTERHSFDGPFLAREPDTSIAQKLDWERFCRDIDDGISQGSWVKIVPARMERYASVQRAPSLADLWIRLVEHSPPGSHRFLWKRGDEVFLGASPELLFAIDKDKLRSDAVAGTARTTEHEDLYCDKILHEHQVVVDDIASRLKRYFGSVAVGSREVLRSGEVAHFRTELEARLPANPSHELARQALLALHPTSAVGGWPVAAARQFLVDNEPFERGYFASPVGFSYGGRSKYLVAIRSAKISLQHVDFFAGAGYVSGSTAEAEWKETALKMRFMQSVLGGVF